MRFIGIFLLILCICSCTTREKSPASPLTTTMLPSQLFRVHSDRDTVLNTLHGSTLRIAAGTFAGSGNINIEIKEALTPREIFAAGLITESDGRPLRSAGMIYINASSNGSVAEMLKPVSVSIPNQFYDSSMQLYKGVETDSGQINWTDPQPLDTTPQSKQWLLGKELFQTKCASCHGIFREGTGPALQGVDQRIPNRKIIYDFIRNPWQSMANHAYFQRLKERYGSVMVAYPDLTDDAIDAIINFTNNEVAAGDTIVPPKASPNIITDSIDNVMEDPANDCGEDTVYISKRPSQETFLNTNSASDNFNTNADTIPREIDDPAERKVRFTDRQSTEGMYEFDIRTNGWYNIDAGVQGYAGTKVVKVWAEIKSEMDLPLHVYLFCPDKQILSVAYYPIDNGLYYFDKFENGVPLFPNDRAILFAFGSQKDKIYGGIAEFTVNDEQRIPITVTEMTEEHLRNSLLKGRLNGIDLGIYEKERLIYQKWCDTLPVVPADTTNAAQK